VAIYYLGHLSRSVFAIVLPEFQFDIKISKNSLPQKNNYRYASYKGIGTKSRSSFAISIYPHFSAPQDDLTLAVASENFTKRMIDMHHTRASAQDEDRHLQSAFTPISLPHKMT
jgi:hypothetical protein